MESFNCQRQLELVTVQGFLLKQQLIISAESFAKSICSNLRDKLLIRDNHLAGSECPIVYWLGRGLRHTGEALLRPPLGTDELNGRRYLRLNWKWNPSSDAYSQTWGGRGLTIDIKLNRLGHSRRYSVPSNAHVGAHLAASDLCTTTSNI